MSGRVYLLMRHPEEPYSRGYHIRAGEVMGVYSSRAEAEKIAKAKNTGTTTFLWAVKAKQVKA